MKETCKLMLKKIMKKTNDILLQYNDEILMLINAFDESQN